MRRQKTRGLRIPQSVGPTSPPQTPTAASPVLNRQGGGFMTQTPAIAAQASMRPRSNGRQPGNGPNSAFTRPIGPEQLSPRSSSSSSDSSESSSSNSESETSDQPEPPRPTPLIITGRVVTHAAFVVEELSDFGESDEDRLHAIRPHDIEYADSDRSRSRSRNPPEIDRAVIYKFQKLECSDDSDETDMDEDEYKEVLAQRRAEKRQQRMSQGSIGKRTISESIGSDTDREDLRLFLGADQVGSSARRLRRRVGNRTSLQFSDPPLPRIDEPTMDDDFIDDEALKELSYYTEYVTMEIDSP